MNDPRPSVFAIVNPVTGRLPAGSIADNLRRQAAALRLPLTIAYTSRPGHAVELARSAAISNDIIVAVGGDGTVSDVATGVEGTHRAIGIVPVGSTNMIAKELGIPRDLTAAILVALQSCKRRQIDVARAGSTTFLHIAGAGFDAAIMHDTSGSAKRRFGWLAYLPAAARHLRYPPFELTITVDGERHTLQARTVLCAIGCSIIDPRFRIGEGIDRSDGRVDICIYNPPSVIATMNCAWWIARGMPGRSRWMRQLRGRAVRLESPDPVPFEVDGDPVGELPVDIRMLDEPITVIVPAGRD